MKTPATRLLSQFRTPWLLAPEVLQDLRVIAERSRAPDFEAVLAKRGKRLDGANDVVLRNGVAVVPVHGPIFRYANLFTDISGATSIEILARDFRLALDNSKVKTIVLDVDSPGGQVAGTSEFSGMVRASRKPVIAYVGGQAASAAYWIASAAQKIVVADTATLGSVGVVANFILNDDESVVEIVSSQSPLKRMDVRTDTGREIAQKQVDELAQIFIETVAANRNVSADRVMNEFGRGSVLIGRTAVGVGMADGVGSLEDLLGLYAYKPPPLPETLPSLAVLIDRHGYDGALAAINAHEKRRLAAAAVQSHRLPLV